MHDKTPKETHEVIRCHIEEHEICTHLGAFFSKGVVKDKIFRKATTVKDCMNAWKTKVYNNTILHKYSQHVWSTNYSLAVSYKYCCFDYCEISRNFIMEMGTSFSYYYSYDVQ